MNKTNLIDAVAKKTGFTKKDVEKTVNALFETIQEALASGDRVQLVGFGTFETRVRKAREGRNPRTGETIQIPETTVPAFKPGKALKDAVS